MEDNDCRGVMGRLFGHHYQSLVEFYTPPEDLDKKIISIVAEFKGMKGGFLDGNSEIIKSMNRTIDKTIEASAVRQYKIVCKRCGKVIPNNGENADFMIRELE